VGGGGQKIRAKENKWGEIRAKQRESKENYL
jgi:hypothetical protein